MNVENCKSIDINIGLKIIQYNTNNTTLYKYIVDLWCTKEFNWLPFPVDTKESVIAVFEDYRIVRIDLFPINGWKLWIKK